MQPYFLPYAGYFSLIRNTDMFILLDDVQFIRHGWIERNRIINYNKYWQYINVSLKKHSQKTKIKNIQINNSINWSRKILAQLESYKKKAPYYNTIIDLLNSVFTNNFENITNLNYSLLQKICNYLDISSKITVFSQMNLDIEDVLAPDEWALNICKSISGVKEYWNPEGGITFFDKEKYKRNGIDVKFLKYNLTPYNQKTKTFESGLSIIDLLMFNSINDVNTLIDGYTIV